jgi:hypothetical protein
MTYSNPQDQAACSRRHYVANRAKILARRAKYRIEKAAEVKAYRTKYNATHTAENTERQRRVRLNNPVRSRINMINANFKRRTRMKQIYIKLTDDEMIVRSRLISECVRLEKELGIQYHIDHIVPIVLGGLDHPVNWQIISEAENCRKGSKMTGYAIKLLPKLLEVYLDRLGVDAATKFADLHKEHFEQIEFDEFLRSLEHD